MIIDYKVVSRVGWVLSASVGEPHAEYVKSGALFLLLERVYGCRVDVYVLEDIYRLRLQYRPQSPHETLPSIHMVCYPITTIYQTHLYLLSQIL